MSDDELPGLESRRRRRRFLGGVAYAIWVITFVIAGQGLGRSIWGSAPMEGPMPIARPSDPGSLYVGTEVGKDGRPTDTYCWAPNERFAQFMTLTNPGPLPMTIYGEGPEMSDGWFWLQDGFGLVDLAPYRESTPADTPASARRPTDPRTAPVLPPTTLDPGGSVEVWARYTTDPAPPASGWPLTRPVLILVKYEVLWRTNAQWVETRASIAIKGPCAAATPTQ
jgi:hypothetical protein